MLYEKLEEIELQLDRSTEDESIDLSLESQRQFLIEKIKGSSDLSGVDAVWQIEQLGNLCKFVATIEFKNNYGFAVVLESRTT